MSRRRTLLGLVMAVSCLAVGASAADARLTFSRPDGSAIRFAGPPRVWCGPWDYDAAQRSVHVRLRNKKRLWDLIAVRRDVEVGQPMEFPNFFLATKPHDASLFTAYDKNEASTAEEESSGSMTFSQVSCRRDGTVAFSIDAVLGSEFIDGELVTVTGTFQGRVGEKRARSAAHVPRFEHASAAAAPTRRTSGEPRGTLRPPYRARHGDRESLAPPS